MIFWDFKEIFGINFKEINTTLNGTSYAAYVAENYSGKRRGILTKTNGCALVYTSCVAQVANLNCGFQHVVRI